MQETVDFEQSYRMVPPSYELVHNPHELVRYIYHRPQIKSLNSPNQTLHSHLSWPLISSQGITASLFEGLSGGHLELNEVHGVHEGSIECTDPANSGDHFGPHFVDWVV